LLKKDGVVPVDGDVLLILPPPPPSRREGGASVEGGPDQLEDGVGLFENLLVREAQDGDAATVEERVAESITALSLGVGRTVDFNSQPHFDAKEVGKVVADGELSTELEAVELSAAEPAPEERLGLGGAVAVPAAEHDLTA